MYSTTWRGQATCTYSPAFRRNHWRSWRLMTQIELNAARGLKPLGSYDIVCVFLNHFSCVSIFSRSVMWATVFSAIAAVVCAVSSDRSLEDKGRVELQRVRDLSQQPRYGECWSRALEKIQSSCKEFSDDVQSKIALSFTHCHLQRSTAHCTGTSLKFAGLQWFAVTPNRPDGETIYLSFYLK